MRERFEELLRNLVAKGSKKTDLENSMEARIGSAHLDQSFSDLVRRRMFANVSIRLATSPL